MRRIFLPGFALALALATTPVFAESTVETPTKTDVPASEGKSDAIVDAPNTPILETIVVRGRSASPVASVFETRHGLDAPMIEAIGGASAAELVRRLPSAHVPTNSRGESVVFLRNAAERQVALFYEGAAINVPWDNRLDLSMVPTGLIGGVQTAAGPLAPHYGVNALAAVSLSPRDRADGARLALAAGSGEWGRGELFVPLRIGAMEFELGASRDDRLGERLSADAHLPYSQAASGLRTNTDRSIAAVFAHSATRAGRHSISLTAFHVEGDKGIAPESDRATGARFWRYPDLRHSLATADVVSDLGAATTLDSAVWAQHFGQTINSYSDASYDVQASQQIDRDRTFGFRELLKHVRGPATWIGSVNFLGSTHHQRDIRYAGGQPPASVPAESRFSQRNWSVGAEFEWALTAKSMVDLGVGVDTVDFVDTGDKPPAKDVQGWNGRAGMLWDAGEGLRLRASLGRKLRAPTMRELFGQALNRFLDNPDLKPERIVTAELAAEWRRETFSLSVIPFMQNVKDTIDQRNVGNLRQRINLEGSRVRGVELSGDWQPAAHWRLTGNATWSDVSKDGTAPGQSDKLAEKPELLARMSAEYQHPAGFRASIEAEHVGRAYSLDATGTLAPLARSTSFNVRVAHEFGPRSSRGEIFLQIDNLADTLIEPQLGLPAPGRSVLVGIRIKRG